MKKIFIIALFISMLVSCQKAENKQSTQAIVIETSPVFVADSAYQYVKNQVDFGPRVPNTKAHDECSAYLVAELKRFGAEIIEQRADLIAFDGTILKSVNIIGSYNPKAASRVLLFAHWDSRPWSDHDPIPENRTKPVLGANDGASGVGVLLEMARHFNIQKPEIGVDIIFFDAEDYGAPESFQGKSEDSWCLGSQYWSKNPHIKGYTAKFGILLDMVGAPDATFYKEEISMYYAGHVVNKVWSVAEQSGFGQYFRDENIGGITDDHLYVNKIIGIPSIDIIHYNKDSNQGFGHYWHTVYDNMENIDKNTLFAVGSTLMKVVYSESL